MSKYLDPIYTFNKQTSYSREEIDRSLDRKANVANVYNRKEIQERTDVLISSIQSVNNQIQQLRLDVSSGSINTTPLGTVVDGDVVDIYLKREPLPYQRPQPVTLNQGELSVGINPLSPFLYLKDSNGEIRRISGIQFVNSLPTGTAYNSGDSNTYPEQRSAGELFYHRPTKVLYTWSGTDWITLNSGLDEVDQNNLKTKIESLVKIEDLKDVQDNSLKQNDYVLTWDGVKYLAKEPKVTSVNNLTGAINLTTEDVTDTGSTNKYISIAEKAKLNDIEVNSTADQTAPEIRDLLQSLTGSNRLNASAISDLPSSTVNQINGLTGNVSLTTNNISDTTTKSYVQTLVNSPNQIIVGNSSGQPVSISPLNDNSFLYYDGNQVTWKNSNTSSVSRFIGNGTYLLTSEFTFCDPASGNIILNLNPAIANGEKYFIKNYGLDGTVTLPDLSNLILSPGQQYLIIWDGIEWQTI